MRYTLLAKALKCSCLFVGFFFVFFVVFMNAWLYEAIPVKIDSIRFEQVENSLRSRFFCHNFQQV